MGDNRSGAPESHLVFFAATCFIGLIAAVVFVGFPQIDIWFSGLFYLGDNRFLVHAGTYGSLLRRGFQLCFVLGCMIAVIGAAWSISSRRRLLGLGFPQWLFVAATLIIGPGLLVNTSLKDHWGRARPLMIEQFGGDLHFTQALERSDECPTNCSFVAGEAASIYAIFFAFALLFPGGERRLLVIGGIAGSLAGLVRIAGGGHYLSDVVFAGVFMALIAEALHWLIFNLCNRTLAEAGPLHRRLHRATSRSGHLARVLSHWRRGALGHDKPDAPRAL